MLAELADDPGTAEALDVNEHGGTRWVRAERYRALVDALTALGLAGAARARERQRVWRMADELAAAGARSRWRLDALTAPPRIDRTAPPK